MNNKIDESSYTGDQLENYTEKQLEMFSADQLEEIETSCTDIEIWESGIESGVNFENIEETYQGEYSSDIEFVEQMLSDMGDLNGLPSYIVIDWERTANDIMMDYSNDNNHYFRNF